MSETLVERMARAICEASRYKWFEDSDHCRFNKHLRVKALAALRAIREPTERMMEQGRYEMPGEQPCRSIWRLMIDAAIAEAEEQT